MNKSKYYILGQIEGIISVSEILSPDMVDALKGLKKDFMEYANINQEEPDPLPDGPAKGILES